MYRPSNLVTTKTTINATRSNNNNNNNNNNKCRIAFIVVVL